MSYWVSTPEFADVGITQIGCDTVEELDRLLGVLDQHRSAAYVARVRRNRSEAQKRRHERERAPSAGEGASPAAPPESRG
jgi:hypothetical protein